MLHCILDLNKDRDSKLFQNVIRDNHILHDLLPPKRKRVLRERKHDFIFPRVRAERFKQSFLNRSIFYCVNSLYVWDFMLLF